MDEQQRNDIVRRRQTGTSLRQIARELDTSQSTVRRVLDEVEQSRSKPALALPKKRKPRGSKLDAYADFLQALLQRYPNITVRRVHEELRVQGFQGGYTIVSERLQQMRPRPQRQPVIRFETGPGLQAQMDYSVYDIDFTQEGRRRVYLFGYLLSYSRRFYARFVESQDLATTLREHVRAFEYLGGVAPVCLYDNMKVVVSRIEDGEPIYNPRFLAFATHYGFRPWACRPRRPQTKGKQERVFSYVQSSLLNGRSFRSLEHLNEVTRWWLARVADVRIHGQTKRRPIELYAEEAPHLLPLPAHAYDTAIVVHRIVNAEGFISYRQNAYSVPYRQLGRILPVRITENEVIVYGPQLEEIARHSLFSRGVTGQQSVHKAHRPSADAGQRQAVLRERFGELGPAALPFLEKLLERRMGKDQAEKILALLGTYCRKDVSAALERAVRFGAFSLSAIERILAAQAKPKSALDSLAEQEQRPLPLAFDPPVPPRSTAEYQRFFFEETDSHESTKQQDDENQSTKQQDDENQNGENASDADDGSA